MSKSCKIDSSEGNMRQNINGKNNYALMKPNDIKEKVQNITP